MKTYFKAIKLVIKVEPKIFYLILFLSVIVGILQGVGLKLNIMLLTGIQDVINGSRNFNAIIIPFIFIILNNPSYYVHTPYDRLLRQKLLNKMELNLLNRIFDKANKAEMVHYENPSLYDHIHKAEESISSQRFISIMNSIIYIPLLFSASVSNIIVIGSYSPFLLIIIFLSMIPFFIARIIRGKGYFKMKNAQTTKLRVMNYLWEILSGRNTNRDMRVYGTTDYLTKKYFNVLDDISKEEWQCEKKHFKITTFFDSIGPIGLGIGILAASYLVFKSEISLAVFASLAGGLIAIQSFTEGLMNNITSTTSNLPFISNFFKFTEQPDPKDGDYIFNNFQNDIELRNVSFRYPLNDIDTLKNISLKIKKDESIALLGENGAGKSTLVKLILGFYKPTDGEIFYDGVNIQDIKKNSLWERTSAVFQDFTRFNLTLKENVGVGNVERIDDSEYINEHLKKLGFIDIIRNLPQGIDTMLGREYKGTDLSGGQWQKVAIARGSIRTSDIIILDEPTASLDPMAESDVFKQFLTISSGKTSLMISHRIGSARLAKRIIIIKEGTIIEDGSHDELLKQNGEYTEIYKLQSSWYS